MDTTLQCASENADRIIAAKRESERLNVEEPMTEYVEEPARGPLAAAYKTPDDLSALFQGHGLAPGVAVGGGFVHDVAGEERAGLVAAILHPQSTRRVAEATAAEPIAEPALEVAAQARGSAGLGPCLVVAALGLAFLARRR
jgi:hypothetical protein